MVKPSDLNCGNIPMYSTKNVDFSDWTSFVWVRGYAL